MDKNIIIKELNVKDIMTKSNSPIGGYCVNPYVGCTHGCKYCYASFMKRFTGHSEEWGNFIDVKNFEPIKNLNKYKGEHIIIGTVTDGYIPLEEKYKNTRKILEQLVGVDAELMICTKSDLVLRDLDLLKKFNKVSVSWSINTLDENFRSDMDDSVSIERKLKAMKQFYDAGIRTICFISPIFPKITDIKKIFEKVKDQCDLIWLENLNLRGGFKSKILDYIKEKYPDLYPLYDQIYNKKDRTYFKNLEKEAFQLALDNDCKFIDNETPYIRAKKGHPIIVDYFYHEEVKGSKNSGKRNKNE